jgi:hypothetical protein
MTSHEVVKLYSDRSNNRGLGGNLEN